MHAERLNAGFFTKLVQVGIIRTVFGRFSGTPVLLFVPVLQRLVDCQRLLLKTDCVPRQADQFSGTETCFQDQRILIIIMGTFGRLKEPLLLIHRKEPDIILYL